MTESSRKTQPAAADPVLSGSFAAATRERPLELELARLGRRVDELLGLLQTLKEENRALRQRHENLTNERAALMQKNEQVRTRVEAMIGRLKTLEHNP